MQNLLSVPLDVQSKQTNRKNAGAQRIFRPVKLLCYDTMMQTMSLHICANPQNVQHQK